MGVLSNIVRFKAACLLIGALALASPTWAASPDVSPALRKMLGSLPIQGKEELQRMVGSLAGTSCGGGLQGCYETRSGPLRLYFFTSGSARQTLLLVVEGTMALPTLLGPKVQKVMGGTSVSSPMFSLSTTEFTLDTAKMPPSLQQVVRDSYFNVASISFAAGVQLAARASLGGAIRLVMESFGAKVDAMTMRAAVVLPVPADLAGAAGSGAAAADAMRHGETFGKAASDAARPEAFVEFQFAPNATLALVLPKMTLTDATFFLNNDLVFGYRGNASYEGAENRKIITHFQTPLSPQGALDLLDFQFYMATPARFTLEDAAHMMFAMAAPGEARLAKYGGGFIRNIESFKKPLLQAVKPLSVFQVQNPNPTEYRLGDPTRPFPTDRSGHFNFIIAGPLAPDGPMLHGAANAVILGQKMGWLDATAGTSGLRGTAGESIRLKLGPLGRVSVKLAAAVAIDKGQQAVSLAGNLDGQKITVSLNGSTMKVEVNATCVQPFEIKVSLGIKADTDIADVFEGQGGVNVDPAKLEKCVGKDLEAAYRKISGEFKDLGGYTAAAATAELKKIDDLAKQAEREAKEAYEKTKNAARDAADKSTSAVTNAFKDAGNAFKHFGKKKKHKKQDDHRFAGSVFDWDYYYDNNEDLRKPGVDLTRHWQDTGFREGRRGSLEFHARYYRARYLDVEKRCKGDDQCALNHWNDYGIAEGRQGSPDFNVLSYMKRYPDVPQTLSNDADPNAMEHWLATGFDAGRNGAPDSPFAGPISGPTHAGGDGGSPWDDSADCKGRFVVGFRVRAAKRVDGVQFLYERPKAKTTSSGLSSGVSSGASTLYGGWAPPRGNQSMGFAADVVLDADEHIVAVNYRSGSRIDAIGFVTSKARSFGPYGGTGGSPDTYTVTPGEKLGCMAGRAGSEIDHLVFSSTGPR